MSDDFMDPYEAQVLRDRYTAAATRPWKILLGAGLTVLFSYFYFIFVVWPFRIDAGMLVNRYTGGVIIATVVAAIATVTVIRHKWPAVVALVCVGPETYRIVRLLADDRTLRLRWYDVTLIGGMVALVITAIVTLVRSRPEPPELEAEMPSARVLS